MGHVGESLGVHPGQCLSNPHVPPRENDRLALNRGNGSRYGRQGPATCTEMYLEHRKTVETLDQLHGCRVAWVDLDRMGNAVAGDEIEPIQAHQPEFGGHTGGKCGCPGEQLVSLDEEASLSASQEAATISEAAG